MLPARERFGKGMAPKRKNRKKYRGFWIFVRIQLVLMLLVVGGIAYYYFGGYAATVQQLSDEARELAAASSESTFRSTETGILYDCKGQEIAIMKGEKDVYYLERTEIPENVKAAIISIEDKKFYQHKGVDYRAIVRAVWAMIRNGEVTQGGSTITQQLARTVFLSQERTWQRKLEEIFLATELEKKYSKEKILEYYLNNIYFGNGYYGIQAASRGYFGVDVEYLDLSQIAFLCAIPNNPTLYDPILNKENTLKRRDRILNQMLEDGKITQTACELAKLEDIELNQNSLEKNNYVETFAYYCATRALMEVEGFRFRVDFDTQEEQDAYDEEYAAMYQTCEKKLHTEGYQVYTSLDLDMQQQLQDSVDEHLADYTEVNEEGIYALQGAAVCIENKTGMVKSIVGGREQEYDGYTLNRGYQSFRQPGSAIKPLLVYTPMLERGYTADSIVTDEPIPDGPTNSNGSYCGEITLRYALEHSVNTIAWKLLEELSPAKGLEYLKEMNFSKISSEDNRLTIALGGFTTGVSPLEMAAGYATLQNDGRYRVPTCIEKILDAKGNEIYVPDSEGKSVYKENAARAMTDLLQGVLTEGTAAGLALDATASAGKTGTTNSNKDGWFVGYSKYYTTSVWVGYDMPRELKGLKGSSYPANIWHDYMTGIHTNLPWADFVALSGLQNFEEESREDEEQENVEQENESQDDENPENIEQEDERQDGENPENIEQENEQQEAVNPEDAGQENTGQENAEQEVVIP